MSVWPVVGPVTPLLLSPHFFPEIYKITAASTAGAGSGPGVVNRAFFYGITIPEPVTVTKAWWDNGSTLSGNVDVGVYDSEGNRYISTGSTVQAGSLATQLVDVTDTIIQPGLAFLAIAVSSATATFQATSAYSLSGSLPIYIQDSAFPLPSQAVYATVAAPAAARIFKFGVLLAPRTLL